jgi:hypothetical protein
VLIVPTHYPAESVTWVADSLAIGLAAGILVIEPNNMYALAHSRVEKV